MLLPVGYLSCWNNSSWLGCHWEKVKLASVCERDCTNLSSRRFYMKRKWGIPAFMNLKCHANSQPDLQFCNEMHSWTREKNLLHCLSHMPFYAAASSASLHHLPHFWKVFGNWCFRVGLHHRWAISSTELSSMSKRHLGAFFFCNLKGCVSTLRDACSPHSLSCIIVLDNNTMFTLLMRAAQFLQLSSPLRSLFQAT